jgi:hypothetical protein
MASQKVLKFKTAVTSEPPSVLVRRRERLPVISVGRDEELLELRKQVLAQAGIFVRSLSPEEAEATAESSQARLWIFCNSLDLPSLMYLATGVRRFSPESKMLLLWGPSSPRFKLSLFHRILYPFSGVDALLRTVDELSVAT